MKKLILFGLLLGILLGGIIAYKMYNKPHADMTRVDVDAKLTASELFAFYDSSESAADQKFLGKVIQITGEVNSVNTENNKIESLALETGDMMTSITCLLDEVNDNHRQDFKVGAQITLNCVCTGKLMDIELNRCVEIIK